MAKSYQAPNNSWMDTWIPAIFGSAPGRLLEIPPRPKPFEQVYGLKTDSITAYTPINPDAGHDKSARSKTTNNDHTQPEAVRFSWHSQTSETMMKLKVPRASNQNRKHTDKVSNCDTNDTLLLTQIWKVQNTIQFARETGTYSPKQKKHSYKLSLSSRRLNGLRAWNKALEGRQRLRRKGRSKTATKSIEKYIKEMGTPPKPTEAAYGPRNDTVQTQPQEPVKQSQCSTEGNPGNTVQSQVQWPDSIAKIGRLFIYVMGFATISASCVGIGIVIYLCFSRVTIREITFSLLSLVMTNLRLMVKLYVDEIISSQQLSVQHTSVPQHTPVSEQPPVSAHTSASAEDKAWVGPWLWKPLLIGASMMTVAKTRGPDR